MWKPFVREVREREVIAFDLPGAGQSSRSRWPMRMPQLARVIVQLLDHLGHGCVDVLGGTQSLHTNSYDEALALPTEDAVRIALRTQQIIADETGVVNTIDPLGGSYFVEALTDEIEAKAYEYFHRIDELGGMVHAVKQAYPQREIADASYELQGEIDAGRRIVVGVNRYTEGDGEETPILKIDPTLEAKQIERLKRVRARREPAPVQLALIALKAAAASERENLMPHLLDSARAHASEGEIVEALQDVWGD